MDGDEDLEIASAYERRMLAHAERQTKALEALQQFAMWWTVLAVFGALIWLIFAVKGGS